MTHLVGAGLARHLAPRPAPPPGKLVVAVTNAERGFRAVRVARFATAARLVEVLLASCYIPVYYEEPTLLAGLGSGGGGGGGGGGKDRGDNGDENAASATGDDSGDAGWLARELYVDGGLRCPSPCLDARCPGAEEGGDGDATVYVSPHHRPRGRSISPPAARAAYPLVLSFLPTGRADYEALEVGSVRPNAHCCA
jgi:hypothetical protein